VDCSPLPPWKIEVLSKVKIGNGKRQEKGTGTCKQSEENLLKLDKTGEILSIWKN
jgi:hypothetical protein